MVTCERDRSGQDGGRVVYPLVVFPVAFGTISQKPQSFHRNVQLQ